MGRWQGTHLVCELVFCVPRGYIACGLWVSHFEAEYYNCAFVITGKRGLILRVKLCRQFPSESFRVAWAHFKTKYIYMY